MRVGAKRAMGKGRTVEPGPTTAGYLPLRSPQWGAPHGKQFPGPAVKAPTCSQSLRRTGILAPKTQDTLCGKHSLSVPDVVANADIRWAYLLAGAAVVTLLGIAGYLQ